jgi:hypothetical protein
MNGEKNILPWIDQKLAGRAGIFSAVLFGFVITAQGALHPGYNQVREIISVLGTCHNGWIQNMNFIITGVAMLIFARGLWTSSLRGFGARFGPALLGVSAIGLIMAGFFPMARAGGISVQTPAHALGAILAFLGAGLGLFFSSLAFGRSKGFRGASIGVGLAGFGVVALFLAFMFLAIPSEGPFHAYAGLLQRVILVLWLVAVIAVSKCLIRQPEQA